MKAMVDEHMYWRRIYVPKETVANLHVRAKEKCEACGDALTHPEVHHIKPVAHGGTNALDNLQLLCHMCHVQISEQQHLSKNPRLCSRFNPEMMELFHNAALKPRVHHWGTGGVKKVYSVDINSCRRNVLLRLHRRAGAL